MAPRLKTKRYQKPTFAFADLDFHDYGGGGGILYIMDILSYFIYLYYNLRNLFGFQYGFHIGFKKLDILVSI